MPPICYNDSLYFFPEWRCDVNHSACVSFVKHVVEVSKYLNSCIEPLEGGVWVLTKWSRIVVTLKRIHSDGWPLCIWPLAWDAGKTLCSSTWSWLSIDASDQWVRKKGVVFGVTTWDDFFSEMALATVWLTASFHFSPIFTFASLSFGLLLNGEQMNHSVSVNV